MDSSALIAALQEAIPGAQFEVMPSVDLQTTIYVSRDDVPAAMRTLRDRDDLAFALLAELTAADFWPREPRFELIYILVSIVHRRRVRLKVRLDGNDARVATVSDVWPAANWLEREVWDGRSGALDALRRDCAARTHESHRREADHRRGRRHLRDDDARRHAAHLRQRRQRRRRAARRGGVRRTLSARAPRAGGDGVDDRYERADGDWQRLRVRSRVRASGRRARQAR